MNQGSFPNFSRYRFPPPSEANSDGLLAIGGDLSSERLLVAYSQGIFPWFEPGGPILWWHPDPRTVLYFRDWKVSKSLRQSIRNRGYEIRVNTCFNEVIKQCATSKRRQHYGTWITESMIEAYCDLHVRGFAHSVETWSDGKLAGGLYGVKLGKMFFGESMFSSARDSSKVALDFLIGKLADQGCWMMDCQLPSAHLFRLGASIISRNEFMRELEQALGSEPLTQTSLNLINDESSNQ